MSSVEQAPSGKAYWRSLDDLAGKPEFRALVRREFPSFADEMLAPSRRDFLKLMGASVALAGATACRRWPEELIVPFAHRPEGYVPGVPVAYATSMETAGAVLGLLVTSYDGRPIKVEGNPDHPSSLGGTDAFAQAAVLQMYDPDRAARVLELAQGAAGERTWDEFLAHALPILRAHRGAGGRGLRVLSEGTASPTLLDAKERLLAVFPGAKWHEWEPLTRDGEREGARLAFGRPLRAQLALDRADVIVALDSDVLMAHPNGVRHARDWAAGRHARDGRMNRTYAVESGFSFVGGVADHRLAVQPRMVPVVAGKIAALLLDRGAALPAGLEGARAAIESFRRNTFSDPLIEAMAKDLAAHRGRGVVVAGPKQPAAVHALVHAINAMLGNAGATVTYTADLDETRAAHVDSMRELAADIDAGRVETLIVLGGNPAFNAPADLDFAAGLAKVKNTFRLGEYADETSRACGWHLPKAHTLEAWSDTRSWDGTYAVAQPLIEPLHDGKTAAELVALLLEEPAPGAYDLVRRSAAKSLGEGPGFEAAWRRLLHDGLLKGSAFAPETPQFTTPIWAATLVTLADVSPLTGADFEVLYERSHALHDGRFANLGWMMELPDPFTKVAWDNPALIAPATAAAIGVASGDVVRVTVSGRSVEVPVFVAPGQAPNTLGLNPGWGRRNGGRVADGVGFDLYPVRGSDALGYARAAVARTGATHAIVTTQDHHVVDALGKHEQEVRSETLIREANLGEYLAHPDFAQHAVHIPEDVLLWKSHPYDGHKWALSVDLTACVGCAACMVACQAENNIPVVGKDEVARGREMHWIRIDRYFQGAPDAPALAFQPMTCHHCENAPCEQVCPVGATVHDSEGLNVMVYNRCVGTRYCSNNCPYKVRRFNWFNNHKNPASVEMMVYNPEVTVRSRGVMEKCTFCVQRIENTKIRAKNEKRPIADGEIVTACQQACPTRAIVFGDLNGKGADGGKSEVAKRHDDTRSYGVLAEINTKPRLKYMARLRNRSEELPAPARLSGGGHHGEKS
jgi:molybdopterin-containing oxidoreductase family iron-sulfur binding subunit